MTLQGADLTIEADVNGDGSKETGKFEMRGNVEITPQIVSSFVIDGRGRIVNSILSELVGDGTNKRQGFYLDLGGGAHAIELSFTGWEGAIDSSGNNLQWGNDPNKSKTKSSATGQDPITQIDVLMRYLTVGEIDSRNPATLAYGEYSSSGVYSSLNVIVDSPRFPRSAMDGAKFEGSMTCIVAADVTTSWDADKRNAY